MLARQDFPLVQGERRAQLTPELSVLAQVLDDAVLVDRVAATLRLAAHIVEQPAFLRTTAATARLAADAPASRMMQRCVNQSMTLLGQVLGEGPAREAHGREKAREFLCSDGVRAASLKTVLLAERLLKSPVAGGALWLSNAIAQICASRRCWAARRRS